MAQLMKRYAEKQLQEEKEMRDLVQQVAEDHKKSKAAKEKLQKMKQRTGVPLFLPYTKNILCLLHLMMIDVMHISQ